MELLSRHVSYHPGDLRLLHFGVLERKKGKEKEEEEGRKEGKHWGISME